MQTEQTNAHQDTFPVGFWIRCPWLNFEFNNDRTDTMLATLSRTESWSLLLLLGICFSIVSNTFQGDGEPLIAALAFSGLAFTATYALTRWLGPKFISMGLKGRDMSKTNAQDMYGPAAF